MYNFFSSFTIWRPVYDDEGVKYSKKSRTPFEKNHVKNNKITNKIETIKTSRTQFSKYFTPRKMIPNLIILLVSGF